MKNTTAPFNVDIRVVNIIDDKDYDVGVIELAKSFESSKKGKTWSEQALFGKQRNYKYCTQDDENLRT